MGGGRGGQGSSEGYYDAHFGLTFGNVGVWAFHTEHSGLEPVAIRCSDFRVLAAVHIAVPYTDTHANFEDRAWVRDGILRAFWVTRGLW